MFTTEPNPVKDKTQLFISSNIIVYIASESEVNGCIIHMIIDLCGRTILNDVVHFIMSH